MATATQTQALDPVKPERYPRRILIAVTGLTPQVLTEALYYLAVVRQPAFVPTEIHLLTTAEGAKQADLSLLDGPDAEFHKLRREYAIEQVKFPRDNIHVARGSSGIPLKDINSEEDNLHVGDLITTEIARLAAFDDAALHVSIAGGRKTMGYLAGQALSLLGRPQDRLSHVLVSPFFENHEKFFYPPKTPVRLSRKDAATGKTLWESTANAEVRLAEIPFLRLREVVPAPVVQQASAFKTLIEKTQQSLSSPVVDFDISQGLVRCGGYGVPLDERHLAFYLSLAERAADGGGIARAATDDECEHYLDAYTRCVRGGVEQSKVGIEHDAPRKLREKWFAAPGTSTAKPRGIADAISETARTMLQKNRVAHFGEIPTHINDELVATLGPWLARRYEVRSGGPKGATYYRLPEDLKVSIVNRGPRREL